MAATAHISWFGGVMRLLPDRLHAALDAWSHRIALEHMERRRSAGRKAVIPPPTNYKLRPWRD
jgi:hypothetical protein